MNVGVGSKVDNAAPVSPRSSAPRPLDFRGRGIPLFYYRGWPMRNRDFEEMLRFHRYGTGIIYIPHGVV